MKFKQPFPFIPLPQRAVKPRAQGMTMVLDKHLSIAEAENLMQTSGRFIDVIKLGWGSSLLYDEDVLRTKIAIFRAHDIKVCTGGTFMELAFEHNKVDEMLAYAGEIGFDAVEVSNGIHPFFSLAQKSELISKTAAQGFYTFSEVGKKMSDEDHALTYIDRVEQVLADLAAGADKVIMEARESGNVGIFNADGKVNVELANSLFQKIDPDLIIWEAPKKEQQVWLIHQLGRDVNIGNVAPFESMSLESLRLGIRADTFRDNLSEAVVVFLELAVSGAIRAQRRDDIVIVVDALRASATIIECFEKGALTVKPVVSADQLHGEITIGERGGEKLYGATFSNSPYEISQQNLHGKKVVLSSTNGAECICTAKGQTNSVLIGSVINAKAVAKEALKLAKAQNKNITILAAGRNNLPAIEDRIGVTEILKQIPSPIVRGFLEPYYTTEIEREFMASDSGMNLARLGYIQDVIYCARLEASSLVPSYDGKTISLIKTK
jgi:phosphosulfolactate synthase (CoM biosynthesis protein A)/phosphosulfolactate phosphohydrolase-like enzyme